MTNVRIKYSAFFTFHHQLVPMGSPSISLFGGWWSDSKERSEQSDNIQFWSFNEKKKRDKTRKQSDFAFTLSEGEPQIQSVNWSQEIVGLCSAQYNWAILLAFEGLTSFSPLCVFKQVYSIQPLCSVGSGTIERYCWNLQAWPVRFMQVYYTRYTQYTLLLCSVLSRRQHDWAILLAFRGLTVE